MAIDERWREKVSAPIDRLPRLAFDPRRDRGNAAIGDRNVLSRAAIRQRDVADDQIDGHIPIPFLLVANLAAADIAARDLAIGRGGEAVRRKSDDEDREPEDENGARENEHAHVRDLLVLDKADQVTG